MLRALPVLAAAGAIAIANVAPASVSRPLLRLLDANTPALRGTGFKPDERIHLVVYVGNTRTTRRAGASTTGTFTVRLPGADSNTCAGFSAVATGSKGSRATFKRAPGQCAVP